MVVYPEGPPPAGEELMPGEAINAKPYDAEENLSFTAPLGKVSAVYYSLVSQLPKWGFQRFKIKESIFVSPVFREYYSLTIAQKEELQAKIKAGLASISQAVADLELVAHDLRKYRQYLDYFTQIKRGEDLIKKGRKEEGENLRVMGEQTLRSVFIDQVDIHTDLPHTPIALRSIASRWPTIISDFMKLSKETKPEEIKLDVSEAEKVILATKNKLYLQWKEMFERTVRERYRRLRSLAEARKNSVEEYKEMLKPTIARYKMITEVLSTTPGREAIYTSFLRPDAQAFSVDSMVVWAWKPFAPTEKYKVTREQFDRVSLRKAGFTEAEIGEIMKNKKLREKVRGGVEALPIEPSVDKVVRRIIPDIEKEYGVNLTLEDILWAREELLKQFKSRLKGIDEGEVWVFSPYFVFLEIPLQRVVLRLPNGAQLEDLGIKTLKAYTETQNIILARLLEIKAKAKAMESYIAQLMGEMGIKRERIIEVEEILKEEMPYIYGGETEKKEEHLQDWRKTIEEFKQKIEKIPKFLMKIGLMRAYGPYEFAMSDRIAKYLQTTTGSAFSQIRSFLRASFEVPGEKVEVKV